MQVFYGLLTFKSQYDLSPAYLSEQLSPVQQKRTLRSSSSIRLLVPKTKTKTLSEQAFSVCAPQLWNSLPSSFTLIENIGQVKPAQKTHLFLSVFGK